MGLYLIFIGMGRKAEMNLDKIVMASVVCVSVGAVSLPTTAQDFDYSVLFICVDDLRNCLDLDGDPIARTPHLDRLASEGRYFRSHYVQVPACGPSRCSLWTGRRIIQTWDV